MFSVRGVTRRRARPTILIRPPRVSSSLFFPFGKRHRHRTPLVRVLAAGTVPWKELKRRWCPIRTPWPGRPGPGWPPLGQKGTRNLFCVAPFGPFGEKDPGTFLPTQLTRPVRRPLLPAPAVSRRLRGDVRRSLGEGGKGSAYSQGQCRMPNAKCQMRTATATDLNAENAENAENGLNPGNGKRQRPF